MLGFLRDNLRLSIDYVHHNRFLVEPKLLMLLQQELLHRSHSLPSVPVPKLVLENRHRHYLEPRFEFESHHIFSFPRLLDGEKDYRSIDSWLHFDKQQQLHRKFLRPLVHRLFQGALFAPRIARRCLSCTIIAMPSALVSLIVDFL